MVIESSEAERYQRHGILIYHDPRPDVLDRHLEYLKREFPIVPFDTVVSNIETGHEGATHRSALTITIDDGHVGNYKLLDVFRKHEVRPTLFVCSSIVGTSRMFWWQHPAAQQYGPEALKRLSTNDRLSKLRDWGFENESNWDGRRALNFEELRAMQEVADIGCHTRFHPILTKCDPETAMREVSDAKREVEQITGAQCSYFAYPNGTYDPATIELVRAAGFRAARTCDLGWNKPGADLFKLRAIPVADDASLRWLQAQMSCIPAFIRYAMHGSFDGRLPQI